MSRFLSYILILSMLLPGSVLAGKLYKWTDDKGKVHYADNPVKGADSKNLVVKSGPKRIVQLNLPNLSNSVIQNRINRGEGWDNMLPPAPPAPAICQRLDTITEAKERLEMNRDCIANLEIRQKYEDKKLSRMEEFYSWKEKQDSANSEELEKIERQRYLVQKEKEGLEALKADKEYLNQPGNVATSNPLTRRDVQDVALQRFKNNSGSPVPLVLPSFSNVDIQTRLGRGENWDALLPPSQPLPRVCRELDFIPDFTERAHLRRLCEAELKEKQSYEKNKIDRIKKYYAWQDSQDEATRGLPRDASKAALDKIDRDSYLLKKEKETLEKLRFEMGVRK